MSGRTMRAAVLHAPGDLRIERVPVPALGPADALVRVSACGICGSDVPRVRTTGTYRFPTIPGHEMAGVIEELGPRAAAERPGIGVGMPVAVVPLVPCGRCRFCEIGAFAQCEAYDFLGSRSDGGFAEYVRAPAASLVPLPGRARHGAGRTDGARHGGPARGAQPRHRLGHERGGLRPGSHRQLHRPVGPCVRRPAGVRPGYRGAEGGDRTAGWSRRGDGRDGPRRAGRTEGTDRRRRGRGGLRRVRFRPRAGAGGRFAGCFREAGPRRPPSRRGDAPRLHLRADPPGRDHAAGNLELRLHPGPPSPLGRGGPGARRGVVRTGPLVTHRIPLDDLPRVVDQMGSGGISFHKILVLP